MSSPDPEAPASAPQASDPAPQTDKESLRKALLGYRVMAWTTGIWLIALCYEVVLKYVVKVDDPPSWIGVVHGWVYFVYLLFTLAPFVTSAQEPFPLPVR